MAGDRPNPEVQRRRLRVELRRARQAAGLTQEQVATELEWSLSKVIRVEAGSAGISARDLEALLRLYRIEDSDRVSELAALARAARERSWWDIYRNVASAGLLQLIGYEAAACITRAFEPLVVPGLLQTEEYARAIIRHFIDGLSAEAEDSLVDLRMRRQELLDRTDPPLLFFVLDESVIRRPVGGNAVMRRQLSSMTEMAQRPNVTIEVVPFSAGAHSGLKGPFVTLEFPETADDDVLYLENARGDLISREVPAEILSYREAFESLRNLSLGPEGSLRYLSQVIDQMP